MYRVLAVDLPGLFDTVVTGTAEDVDSGRRVRFGGDHRPMRDVREALAAGDEVLVDLEGWQILGEVGS